MLLRILQNGQDTGMIIDSESPYNQQSMERLTEWVNRNLKQFNLNEDHSCKAELVDVNKIIINGDEDFVELHIQKVEEIKMSWQS
jgi:hypothetical protein